MGFAELLILALGLSMDAFAVSVCKGLSIQKLKLRHALVVGAWFGAFQALMPAVGCLLGSAFAERIEAVDHWIAFVLLALIGGNMVREALGQGEEDCDPSLAPAAMLLLAVATSIDALAVGVTFAFLQGGHRARRRPHRGMHLRHLGGGGEDRQRVWRPLPGQSGAAGRGGAGADRAEDPAGAPGHPAVGHTKRPPPHCGGGRFCVSIEGDEAGTLELSASPEE